MKPTTLPPEVLNELVTRFLCWRLPKDFSPDAGVSFAESAWWPVGTNLLTAEQAKEMFETCFSGLLFQELPLIDEDEITQLRAENTRLTFALAETEALELSHGEVIERLRAENAALAAQNQQMWEVLDNHQGNYTLSRAECKKINDILELPDLSTIPLARARAEAMRAVADFIEDTYDFIGNEIMVAEAIRAKADEIEKEAGL